MPQHDILAKMRSLLQSNRTVFALCFNGIVLLLILLAVSTREGRSFGQTQPPSQATPATAPSTGLTVMPAQLSLNTWGCYVMDAQNQTLCVYQFSPGEHELRLAAARDIQYDRKLANYNTAPPPTAIRDILERAEEPSRAAPTTERSPETAPQ